MAEQKILEAKKCSNDPENGLERELCEDPSSMHREQERVLSSSLAYLIRRCGSIFRWTKWASNDEFIKSVPPYFVSAFTAIRAKSGKDFPMFSNTMLDISTDPLQEMEEKLGSVHIAVYTFMSFDSLSEFHTLYTSTRLSMLRRVIWSLGRDGKECSQEQIDILVQEKGVCSILSHAIANITGYFSIEIISRHLSEYPEALFSSAELSDLFEVACVEIDHFIRRHFKNIRNPDIALQVKEQIVFFSEMMSSDETFGLRSQRLYDTLQYMWEGFLFLLEGVMRYQVKKAMDQGQYQPFYVATEQQFEMYIEPFMLDRVEIDYMKDKYVENNESSNSIDEVDRSVGIEKDIMRSSLSGRENDVNRSAATRTDSSEIDSADRIRRSLDSLEEAVELELIDTLMASTSSPILTQTIESVPLPPPRSTNSLRIEVQTEIANANVYTNVGIANACIPEPKVLGTIVTPLFMSKKYPFSCGIPAIVRDIFALYCRIFLFLINNPHVYVSGGGICEALGEIFQGMAMAMNEHMLADDLETPISKVRHHSWINQVLSAY